jgi:hypothetical protein
MSNSTEGKNQNLDDFQSIQVNQSKFWKKFKQDPVVPIGMKKISFHFIIGIYLLRYGGIWCDCIGSNYWI